MPDLPKYHSNPQRADALLRPLALTVEELHARTRHYLERMSLDDQDRAALESARVLLGETSATLTRLWREGQEQPQR